MKTTIFKQIKQKIYDKSLISNNDLTIAITEHLLTVAHDNSDYAYVDSIYDLIDMIGKEEISVTYTHSGLWEIYELTKDLKLTYNCSTADRELECDACRFVNYELTLDPEIDGKEIYEMQLACQMVIDAAYDLEVA